MIEAVEHADDLVEMFFRKLGAGQIAELHFQHIVGGRAFGVAEGQIDALAELAAVFHGSDDIGRVGFGIKGGVFGFFDDFDGVDPGERFGAGHSIRAAVLRF